MSAALAAARHPSLTSRTRALAETPDLLAALSDDPDGFAWLHDGAGLVTSGVAARIRVRRGPGRLDEAAAEVAALLAAIESDDTVRLPGSGPLAVGALRLLRRRRGRADRARRRDRPHPDGPGVEHGDGPVRRRPGRRRHRRRRARPGPCRPGSWSTATGCGPGGAR